MPQSRSSALLLCLSLSAACNQSDDPNQEDESSDDSAATNDSSEDSTPTLTGDSDPSSDPDDSDPSEDSSEESSQTSENSSGDDDDDNNSDMTPGCGTPWSPTDGENEDSYTVVRRTIEVAGTMREYLISVPMDYDPDQVYPLVFGFHGSGGDREQLRRYMNVERPAGSAALFIYPGGLAIDGGDTGWDLAADSDDLTFVDMLIDHYANELCFDRKRIFATGHSFGGCMSNTVGCYRGDVFRAIAPIAGCGPFGNAQCTAPVATLMIHSPKDTATNYQGAVSGCTRWLRASMCDEMPMCGCHFAEGFEDAADECIQTAQEPYDTKVEIEVTERDEKPPELRTYLGCDERHPIVFADHWRREKQEADDPNERWHNPPPWSAPLIWEFFSSLPR